MAARIRGEGGPLPDVQAERCPDVTVGLEAIADMSGGLNPQRGARREGAPFDLTLHPNTRRLSQPAASQATALGEQPATRQVWQRGALPHAERARLR